MQLRGKREVKSSCLSLEMLKKESALVLSWLAFNNHEHNGKNNEIGPLQLGSRDQMFPKKSTIWAIT